MARNVLSLGKHCAAYDCVSRQYKLVDRKRVISGIKFYRFPISDNARVKQWCQLIKRQNGRDGFKVSKYTMLCEKHFEKGHIYRPPGGIKSRILKDAKPTLHSWNYFSINQKERTVPLGRSRRKKMRLQLDVEENEQLVGESSVPVPVFKSFSLPQQQCPAPVITDVGQPVTVSGTAQVVTAVGSNNRQISSHPFGPTECVSGLTVFNSQVMRSSRKVTQPRQLVKQTDMRSSQVRPSKRSSQVMKEHKKWRRESAGSSVGDQELGLVTDRDFMTPNSKVAKSVGQPVTLNDTAQVVTAVGSNDNRQISSHPFGATEVCVSSPTFFNISQEMRSSSEVTQPRRLVKQTDMRTSQVRPTKRSSQVMKEHRKWWRESTGSSVGDQELGLVTDRDAMAPNSKVAKSEANVMPHAVLQEDMIFPQSKIAATQKEKQTLTVPNHQVAVMSNLLLMWKAGQFCDFYISNGSTNIMVHKMVLGAVCPKMLPVLNSSYSKVTLPSYISKEAMLAFAEYMYTGVLDLNQDILVQLKTIAQRLDMKDFEQLCSSELHKAKAAPILSVVGVSLMTEPCSLSGLLPSSTQRTTDTGHSQNTTFRPLLKPLENVNSSNSQRVVPTDNLTTVGGPLSSLSVPTLRSAPATTTAGQVIDIKIELESDEETLSIPSPKMEPCSPVRDLYGIQEDLLLDFENITSNTRVGLQLARPSTVSVPSNIATITDLFPTTSNSIPYPVGLFTSGGIKITPALQENCV